MYEFIRRKQLPATAWYAVMSYGAESACSRDLLRSITTLLYRVFLTFEEAFVILEIMQYYYMYSSARFSVHSEDIPTLIRAGDFSVTCYDQKLHYILPLILYE